MITQQLSSSLTFTHVSSILFPVSDSSSQGFDPSEFPVLSIGNRARHDSAGGLITSSAISQRPGYGMYFCCTYSLYSHCSCIVRDTWSRFGAGNCMREEFMQQTVVCKFAYIVILLQTGGNNTVWYAQFFN